MWQAEVPGEKQPSGLVIAWLNFACSCYKLSEETVRVFASVWVRGRLCRSLNPSEPALALPSGVMWSQRSCSFFFSNFIFFLPFPLTLQHLEKSVVPSGGEMWQLILPVSSRSSANRLAAALLGRSSLSASEGLKRLRTFLGFLC